MPPIERQIAEILDKHTLVANVGKSDGVESGMKFQIYTPGRTVRDPESNEVLGEAPDVEKGEVVANEVMENMTVMKSKTRTYTKVTPPANFQVPDIFKTAEETVVKQEELNTQEPVPEDRTKISEGDSIRQIIEDNEESADTKKDSDSIPE
jgi:hypothetical protein